MYQHLDPELEALKKTPLAKKSQEMERIKTALDAHYRDFVKYPGAVKAKELHELALAYNRAFISYHQALTESMNQRFSHLD